MAKVKYSFVQWCQDNGHEDWLELWDYELNNCSPFDIPYGSNKKVYFKCARGIHESEEYTIHKLINKKKPILCRKCASFGQWLIDSFGNNAIQDYWSELNTIDPFLITQKSGIKVFIKCLNNKDHPDYLITPAHFVEGNRCPTCTGKRIVVGINDIGTVRPDIADLFLNYEDRFKYTTCSGKRTYFKCPNCGNIIDSAINNVVHFGLSCKKCGDGISYPNKFTYNFVEQVSKLCDTRFDFRPEKIFDWSKNYQHKNKKLCGDKIYDMYICDYDIIIENQGDYHYNQDGLNKIGSRTLEEVQENDRIKMELALKNGIKEDHYVVLDCSKSDMNYIKDSIMSSNLPQLLHFTEEQIDWNECNRFASSSRVYEACSYWNNNVRSYTEIASIMKMDRHTIKKYITRGKELGIISN